MKISKILSPPWKTKQQTVSKITSGSEANQPPIKKGLFGIFGGKKQPTVEAKPSAFDISVVDAKKGVCDNQNLEIHTKVLTVETPETAPQMTTPAPTLVVKPSVSSIIEKYNKAVAETKEASPKEQSSAKNQLSLVAPQSMPQNPPTSNPTNVGPIENAPVNNLVETKAPLQEIKQDTPNPVVEVPKESEVVEDEEEAREEYAIEDR
jgi:hypothetical protein